MDSITWLEPKKNIKKSKKDVNIAIESYKLKDGTERYRTRITFRNDCYAKITHDDVMSVGSTTDRIWFKDGIISGFRVSKSGACRCIRVPAKLEDFVGDYTLHRGATGDTWYISKEER